MSNLKDFRSSVLTSLPQLSAAVQSTPLGRPGTPNGPPDPSSRPTHIVPNPIWWSDSTTNRSSTSCHPQITNSGSTTTTSMTKGAMCPKFSESTGLKNLIDSGFSTETTRSSNATKDTDRSEDSSGGSSSSPSGGGGEDPLWSLLDLIQHKVITNQLKLVSGSSSSPPVKSAKPAAEFLTVRQSSELGRLDSICGFYVENSKCSGGLRLTCPVEPGVLKAVLCEFDPVELQRQILLGLNKIKVINSF